MRDVNNGWLIRYFHSNTASAFFFIVYLHIGRGLYYGSYQAPRSLTWYIGTVIFILMMAKKWPNWILVNNIYKGTVRYLSLLPFVRARTRAILRIGPHNKDVLSVIVCGMLGDWWADEIKGQILPSVRFNIEQSVKNSAYIHNLSLFLFEYGYCSSFVPKLVKKSEGINDKRTDKSVQRFNYRLTLFTYTNLHWIYQGFYHKLDGVTIKKVPEWIGEYLTPLGLAHWIMLTNFVSKQGLMLSTQFKNKQDVNKIRDVLLNKYNIKSTIYIHEEKTLWICIKNESLPVLYTIVNSYIHPSFFYLFHNITINPCVNPALETSSIKSLTKVSPAAIYINADL